jgi:hypothetical protein
MLVECSCGHRRYDPSDGVDTPPCPNCKPFFKRTTLEIDDLEQPAKAFAERRGWLYEKVTSASRRGWPDRFLARASKVVLVEWKKPGEEPTTQQLKRHRELREDYGLDVRWYNDLEAFKRDFY